MGGPNLAEHLFARRAPNIQPGWLAEILERLVWLTDDNGSEIVATIEQWLQGDDPERAAVAVEFREVFPFHGDDRLFRSLSDLSERWPGLASRCHDAAEFWRASARKARLDPAQMSFELSRRFNE